MKSVNIREAKTNLSRLVAVIARAGKPLVKVVALDAPSTGEVRRVGFLSAHIKVPDDFDRMSDEEIGRLFGATS
jgi:antitoxin (DNA-binding transcriptional repressor) of toxin-antitoxin stability system